MYLFLAHYSHVYTGEHTTREIRFDGQFFADDKECYMYAMSQAYDLTGKDECFDAIELISC